MFIHRLMHLPHDGLNPANVFGRKTGEMGLVKYMKTTYKLVKRARGYSIMYISDLAV